MSDDWQVGDLALCVLDGAHPCRTERLILHAGTNCPPLGSTRRVEAVIPCRIASNGRLCSCSELILDDGTIGVVWRFLKIRPDKHEDCEPEFVELLQRIKRRVPA